jgi:hypothetical protein
MITARAFLHALWGGSSLPLVVAGDDGAHYVVRMRGAGDGVIALIVDWIALGLARWYGLPAREPVPIAIDAALAVGGIDPEIRELIERSEGINLGLRYAESATAATPEQLAALAVELRRRVFMFDVLLLNIDRAPANSDLLCIDGGLVVHDFGAAMALRRLLTATGLDETRVLPELRRHALYEDLSMIDAATVLGSAPAHCDVAAIVDSVPQSLWTACDEQRGHAVSRDEIVKGLFAMLADATALQLRLTQLAAMSLIGDSDRESRRRRNRAAFTAKHAPRG